MSNRTRTPMLLAGVATIVVGLSASLAQNTTPTIPAGLTAYPFGTPSGDEVEMLELINRARANPNAEGQRLVAALQVAYPNGDSGFDYGQLEADFAGYPVRPPIAFNADLNAAAASHLKDDEALGSSPHTSPDGTTPEARVQQFGYAPLLVFSENTNGVGYNDVPVRPWTTHADYELNDLGHRNAILETNTLGQVELGTGFLSAGGWNVEDFGGRYSPPLLTGVVFSDNAATGFYASGEGVEDVLVTSSASSFYALTVNGAYALPLDLVAAYDAGQPVPEVSVMFTNAAGGTSTQPVTLGHTVMPDPSVAYFNTDGRFRYDNAKADWVLPASTDSTPTPAPTPTPILTPVSQPSVTITPAPGGTGFIVSRTGDTSGPLLVSYVVRGTAVAGRDYLLLKGSKKLKAGKAQASINVTMLPGATGSLKLVLTGTNAYTVGAPGQGKLRLSGPP